MADSWEDEWEPCNDDGFVYKRRKRIHFSTLPPPIPDPDPEAEAGQRRLQKKKILMKIRDRYRGEIEQWERLSSIQKMNEQNQESLALPMSLESTLQPLQMPENVFRPLIDELLLQAEAQEAILGNLSNLCDVAEALCKEQEECWKKALIDLPVWATPQALMASLSEAEDGERNSETTN